MIAFVWVFVFLFIMVGLLIALELYAKYCSKYNKRVMWHTNWLKRAGMRETHNMIFKRWKWKI